MIDGAGYNWVINNGTLNKTLLQMPNPNGDNYNSGVGHIGHGHARVTFVSY